MSRRSRPAAVRRRRRPAVGPGPGHRILATLQWSAFAAAFVGAVLFLTWRLLAAFDFAYPVFYDVLDLGATIERYGPDNERRSGFHRTGRDERERVFGALVEAVRNDGAGLAALSYHTPDGRELGRLLTPAEIRHLEDVAALVMVFERTGWLALTLALGLAATAVHKRRHPPPRRSFAAGIGVIVAAVTAIVLALGPERVFYWGHEQVFPADHQWFFYYEESLMSMMMRAPDLFGAIAVLWLVSALLVGGVAFEAVYRLIRLRARERYR